MNLNVLRASDGLAALVWIKLLLTSLMNIENPTRVVQKKLAAFNLLNSPPFCQRRGAEGGVVKPFSYLICSLNTPYWIKIQEYPSFGKKGFLYD